MSMLWRRAFMAISLPLATLCAASLFDMAADLKALGFYREGNGQLALACLMLSWVAISICWLIWSPSHQEWLGAAAADDAEVDA